MVDLYSIESGGRAGRALNMCAAKLLSAAAQGKRQRVGPRAG